MLRAMRPGAIERYQIAYLHPSHIPGAAKVISVALPDSLLSALGTQFLEELISSYISLPGGCAYVCTRGDRVVGLVVGSEDSGRHRQLLLRWRWFAMALRVARGVILSPHLLVRVLKYLGPRLPLRRLAPSDGDSRRGAGTIPAASLVFLAVDPEHQRHGIGNRLSRAFLAGMSRRGVRRVKLAVGADNERALSFYLSRGWRMVGRFRTSEGRPVYRLVRSTDLSAEARGLAS